MWGPMKSMYKSNESTIFFTKKFHIKRVLSYLSHKLFHKVSCSWPAFCLHNLQPSSEDAQFHPKCSHHQKLVDQKCGTCSKHLLLLWDLSWLTSRLIRCRHHGPIKYDNIRDILRSYFILQKKNWWHIHTTLHSMRLS